MTIKINKSNYENQNIELKETWRDEYIKWICGFANAQGGVLIIGKDDNGLVKGIPNFDKLMEDIPNKIRDILGILVDVNLKRENNLAYLEIVTEPQPYPVNYKGEYHYRSGSTKQELKGSALNKFLLQKQGKHWDAVPVPHLESNELSISAFDYFRAKAKRGGRISPEALADTNEMLLDNLQLKEGDYLKRAATLLFHANPEKYNSGAYIKIGFFKTDADLIYQDEIHGNLFEQADKALELIFTKYLRAYISYEGISRVETYPFPEGALREAILNAIVHKDYSSGIPIQISVYEDRLYIWNQGQLPQTWTVKSLLAKHPSIPFNPLIANAFFRSGFIEAWGRGFEKIKEECKKGGNPLPILNYDLTGLMIEFKSGRKKTTVETLAETTVETLVETTAETLGAPEILAKLPEKTLAETTVETLVETTVENNVKPPLLIMQLLAMHPMLTLTEVSKRISKSPRAVEKAVSKLVNDGYLEHIGPKKGGLWKVKKSYL